MIAALQRDAATVTRVSSAREASEALHAAPFDLAFVSHPLPDADVIGSCATLAEVPGVPPIILADAIDQTAAIENTVPTEMRPKRVLLKPFDFAKLADLVRETLDRPEGDPPGPETGFAPLVHHLSAIARDTATGTLEVRGDGLCTRVFFENGTAVSAEGGSLRETLGRMLLRTGDLSEEDYVRVIDRMTEQIFENEQLRMGEVLIEFGLLSQDAVNEALAHQVAEKVTSCFQWRDTTTTFDPDDIPAETGEPLEIAPTAQLVLAGLRLYVTGDEIREALAPDRRKRLERTADVATCVERLALGADEERTVAAIDGKKTLGALLADDARVHVLGALVWMGLARVAERSAPERKRRAPVHRGRPEFAREVVLPRRRPKPAAAETEEEPEATATDAPPAPEDNKSKLEAERLFRRAQSQIQNDRFGDAVSTMGRVIELQPLEPEYRMVEAWAVYLHARVEARIARAKVAASARRMAEADTKAAVPHAILGTLALEDGDDATASKEFQAALMRDPENEDARRGIKQVRGTSPS